jgi:hypothetical protein
VETGKKLRNVEQAALVSGCCPAVHDSLIRQQRTLELEEVQLGVGSSSFPRLRLGTPSALELLGQTQARRAVSPMTVVASAIEKCTACTQLRGKESEELGD